MLDNHSGVTMSKAGKTSVITLFAAWVVVSVPLGWGIYNTALNAAKLFYRTVPPAGTQTHHVP
jgi:hypothetical protein